MLIEKREERVAFVLALLLGFLAARSLRAFLSTLNWSSLVTLRLNESAYWLLFLLLVAIVPRRALSASAAVAIGASALLGFARFTPWYVPLGALAATASLAALARLPLTGAAVGLALEAALLVANGSRDPTLGIPGALLIALAGGAVLWRARGSLPTPQGRPRILDGVTLALFLGVQLAFLANPFGLARWTTLPPWLVGLASLGGLVLGATRLRGMGPLLAAAGALGVLELALLRTPLAPLSILFAQVALGAGVARLRPHPWTLALALPPLLFQLVYFAQPLGISDWGRIFPLLALATLALGARLPRMAPGPRMQGALPAAVVAALVLLAAIPPPAAPAEEEGEPLRVVSWNVRQGFGNRGALDLGLYERVLRSLDPDVIVLQESGPPMLSSGGLDVPLALAEALGFHATHGAAGVSILSRTPFVETRPMGADWSHEAAIDRDGALVWIHGVHLGRSPIARHEQAQEILQAFEMRPGPRILAGDMNSCPAPTCFGGRPSDGVYDVLAAHLDDAWVAAGHDRADPAGHTHPAWNPTRRIDQVYVSGFDVLEARSVRTAETGLGSDHLPVLVVARLSQAIIAEA